jgi:hypothetical protein
MYSFARRKDTTVVDEPLYAHYLSKTTERANHPGTAEVLASQENDGEKVVRKVIFGEYQTPVVLFKQMTHHLTALNLDFLLKTENILLIRNPREIIASYSKVVPNPSMQDVGVEQQFGLFNWLNERGKLTAVIDAGELLKNPRSILSQLCERLKIPFDEKMLTWSPGPRPEDGVWAKYWYENVHRSSGFQKYEPKEINLAPAFEELAQECEPFYHSLYAESLKAEVK